MTYLVVWCNSRKNKKIKDHYVAFRSEDWGTDLKAREAAEMLYNKKILKGKTYSASITTVIKSTDY